MTLPLEPGPQREALLSPGAAGSEATERSQNADGELVDKALRGHEADVERFIVRMQCIPRILCAANSRQKSRLSAEDLADLGQDVLVIVWRKLSTFDGRSSLESWIYGIAWFELRNAIRRSRRLPGALDPEEDAHPRDLPATQGGADEEIVRLGLSRLDPAEATIIRMRHFEDLTFEQAALRLEVSVSAAKSRYYRGLEKLRDFLRTRVEGERR